MAGMRELQHMMDEGKTPRQMFTVKTIEIRGKKFVLLTEAEYRRLTRRSASPIAPMPPLSPDGTYPAAQAMRAMMARKIIAARNAVGLSQTALARNAGIRVETLNRLEKGKHTPVLATLARINRALDDAGAPDQS
jgi:DNA-binding XRE family transcriptional regulator